MKEGKASKEGDDKWRKEEKRKGKTRKREIRIRDGKHRTQNN